MQWVHYSRDNVKWDPQVLSKTQHPAALCLIVHYVGLLIAKLKDQTGGNSFKRLGCKSPLIVTLNDHLSTVCFLSTTKIFKDSCPIPKDRLAKGHIKDLTELQL